jgi:hypothetical protein
MSMIVQDKSCLLVVQKSLLLDLILNLSRGGSLLLAAGVNLITVITQNTEIVRTG